MYQAKARGSRFSRARWLWSRLCAMDQSTSASSIILPIQSRRAEFQPAVGRACVFSSSSVGLLLRYLLLGRAGSSLDRRPLGGTRVESPGRGAQRGAGGVRGSTCMRRNRVGLCMPGCGVHATRRSLLQFGGRVGRSCSLLPILPLTHSTPSWLRPFSISKSRFFSFGMRSQAYSMCCDAGYYAK